MNRINTDTRQIMMKIANILMRIILDWVENSMESTIFGGKISFIVAFVSYKEISD